LPVPSPTLPVGSRLLFLLYRLFPWEAACVYIEDRLFPREAVYRRTVTDSCGSFAEMPDTRRDSNTIMLKDDQSEDLFGNWQMQTRAVLRKKKLLAYVEREERERDSHGEYVEDIGKPKAPEPMTGISTKTWKAWKEKSDEAAGLIFERLDPDQYTIVKGIDDSPLAMWEALAEYHLVKGLGSIVSIYEKIMRSHKDETTSIASHVSTIRKLVDHLENLGEPVSTSFMVACILVSLPEDYRPIILKLDGDPRISDINYVTARLQNFDVTYGKGPNQSPSIISGGDISLAQSQGLMTRTRRPVSELTCFNCGKRGHIRANCREPPRANPDPASTTTLMALTSGQPAAQVGELTQYYEA
jgi:hypothetical protein